MWLGYELALTHNLLSPLAGESQREGEFQSNFIATVTTYLFTLKTDKSYRLINVLTSQTHCSIYV